MARTTTTTLHHLVGLRFVGVTPGGQRVMIDNEKEARTGMGPMELLLNALAGCAAMDVVVMLGKRKLTANEYRIEMVGERADATPSPYTRITAKHVFDVPGLDEDTARRFVGLAMHKYCSVGASLNAEIDFDVELLHESAPETDAPEAVAQARA